MYITYIFWLQLVEFGEVIALRKWIKLLLALLLIFSGWYLYQQLPPSKPTVGTADVVSPVYLIDAGHGGEDGGAISVTGTSESAINLAIARRMEQFMVFYGAQTMMLRTEDCSLHDAECQTLREKKVSDLKNRVSMVEEQSNGILISIHQNSYPEQKYHGFQLFYAPTEGSQMIAEQLRQTMVSAIDSENTREVKQIYDTVYLMNHITRPAVLVECGFVTNPEEAVRLEQAEYQLQLAMTIGAGVMGAT